MRTETSSATRAGAFVGGLYLILTQLILYAAAQFSYPKAMLQMISNVSPSLSTSTDLSILILIYLTLSFILAGVGAVLGRIFVRYRHRLPSKSTYAKAIVFGLILYLVPTIPRLILRGEFSFSDFYFSSSNFYANVLCSITFAYLFNRWTNHSDKGINLL